MRKPKVARSYRLSDDAGQLIVALATQLELSKTAVLEMAVRKLARNEFGEGGGPALTAVSQSEAPRFVPKD